MIQHSLTVTQLASHGTLGRLFHPTTSVASLIRGSEREMTITHRDLSIVIVSMQYYWDDDDDGDLTSLIITLLTVTLRGL